MRYNDEPGRRAPFGGVDVERTRDLERQSKWYELEYTLGDPGQRYDATPGSVVERITDPASGLRELAEYAAQFRAFFFIALHRENDGTDTWTIMPAVLDKGTWQGAVTESYRERLKDAWAHIIIDPGDAAVPGYTDSEQLGVLDAYCGHQDQTGAGMLAFDVSVADGIRWDRYSMGRGTAHIQQDGWVDWNGLTSDHSKYEYTGQAVEVRPLGRTAMQFEW